MKRLLALIFALIWLPAMADLVARNGANELRLRFSPCMDDAILGHLKDEWRPKFSTARAQVGTKSFVACWIDTHDGTYFVIFQNGQSQLYPVTGFLDEPGT